jgi:hypothetical protein
LQKAKFTASDEVVFAETTVFSEAHAHTTMRHGRFAPPPGAVTQICYHTIQLCAIQLCAIVGINLFDKKWELVQ